MNELIHKEKFAAKLFLRPKPVRMMVCLKSGPKYATIVAKEVDCTYSHTVKLLELFRVLGLVEFEKRGRIKMVKLTDIGEDLAKTMDTVLIKLVRLKEKTA